MRLLRQQHSQEEDWGLFLIDTRNAFNEENLTAMLWDVRHGCNSGAQFTFNCYRHWATLVVRDTGDRSGHFLHSKEGVTQGEPLAMIAYGIGVFPLIRELRDSPSLPVSLNFGTRMTRGQGGNLGTSWNTSRTCRQGGHRGATSQS